MTRSITTYRRGILTFAAVLLAAAASTVPVAAGVIDVAATGFEVQETAHIAAPAAQVYAELTTPAHWWNSDHTFSGDAANLSLDAKAGGCWCETLPNGGSALHLTVVEVVPGKVLRLRGALGPFQGGGVDGAMTWVLKTAGDGTDVSLTYVLGGYHKDGFEQLSKAADGVLADQVARLKRYVETHPSGKH
jgi:uncharacterized protein YndB with AHSA1/START domain